MTKKTDISFFAGDNSAEIKRRRALAEMMAQATPEMNPAQMAGNLVVPVSPFAALAGGISQGVQSYQNTKANNLEAEDTAKKQALYAQAMANFETNPKAAQAALMQIDPALGIQLANAMKDTTKTTPQIQNYEYLQSLPADQRAAAQAIIAPKAQGFTVDPETGEVIASYSDKPLPSSLQKIEDEALQALSGAKTAVNEISTVQKNLESGELDLGPVRNIQSNILNFLGSSTPNSRAYSDFKRSLETSRNSILLLHKGVQTEGDAQRAMNQILENKNDPDVVRAAMADLVNLNNQAMALQRARIQRGRMDVNARPLDIDSLLSQNIQQQTPAAPPQGTRVRLKDGRIVKVPQDKVSDLVNKFGGEIVE